MTDPAAAPPVAQPAANSMAKYKLVFLGDQSVGKTSIITRFMYDTFDSSYQLRLQIWDTAGQERFRSLIPSYIRDSSVAVICYDITMDDSHSVDRDSFLNTSKWIDDVRMERGNEVVLMLCGNKNDNAEQRVVTYEEGEMKAKEYEVMFIETSAKVGNNVKALFRKVAAALPGLQDTPVPLPAENVNVVNLEVPAQPATSGCPC